MKTLASTAAPSPWVVRFLRPAQDGQTALDIATGAGRHARYALNLGYAVTAIDRDLSRAADLVNQPHATMIEADLEDGSPWPLPGQTFHAVIVTNYLHRPLLPTIVSAVAPDGVLIYETFARGNERFGKPSNPHFLLEPGELLEAVHGRLTPVAFEQGTLNEPYRIVQRLAAVGPKHPWHDHPPSIAGDTPS